MQSNLLETGLDLNYWFAICRSNDLKNNQAIPVVIWDNYYVLYRDQEGRAYILDDRCAHRKVALHKGHVEKCNIVCPYHGWQYNGEGQLSEIPYWPQNKKLPSIKLNNYPLIEKDGIIWMFPGSKTSVKDERFIPDTSVYENSDWIEFELDRQFDNHFAIGIINGMDYYHFHLHRKYQPWNEIEIVDFNKSDGRIFGEYKITIAQKRAAKIFKFIQGLSRKSTLVQSLKVHFIYPYHLAEVDENIKIWVYFTPINQKSVKVFIRMYIKSSGFIQKFRLLYKKLLSKIILNKIQFEDAWIGLQEQTAWERYPMEHRYEVNPISAKVQQMIFDKWEAYLKDINQMSNNKTCKEVCDLHDM